MSGRRFETPGYLLRVLLLLGLTGCSDELRLLDLRIVSIEMVEASDHEVPDSALRLRRDGVGVIRLVLGANRDLQQLVHKHSLHLALDVYDCADPTATMDALAYVYDSSGVPLLPGYDSTRDAGANTAAAYMAIAAPERETLERTEIMPAYDLTANPIDLCLQLRGGRMVGLPMRSDVLRVDAERVRSALEGN